MLKYLKEHNFKFAKFTIHRTIHARESWKKAWKKGKKTICLSSTLVNAQPSECKFQKRQISKFLSIREYLTQFYNDTATISSQGLHHLQASTVKIKCSKPHQTSAVAYFTTSSMDVHPSLLPEATSVTKFDIS
jgi:hypothetical protein